MRFPCFINCGERYCSVFGCRKVHSLEKMEILYGHGPSLVWKLDQIIDRIKSIG